MNPLRYKSTRGGETNITASQAIINGICQDGGLYVPDQIPRIDISLEALSQLSYQDLAYEIMRLYLTDFSEEELRDCIHKAYDYSFDTKDIAPVVEVEGIHFLELFHGPTIAFKDMALSLLPHLMTTAAKKQGVQKDIVILTATSGDTGKAAMAGFADVEGTRIIVFYPKDGVSPIQEQQMVTQKGTNTSVVAVEGNFDDAQTSVKKLFTDKELQEKMKKNEFRFSSANSINIGRLVPQIVYYFYTYSKLLNNKSITNGEHINIVVPTGNFGNILAAYYAKCMGLPVHKLICASNDNKVLYDFMTTGIYNKNRDFILTITPSMDILISSNLERLLYQLSGNSSEQVTTLMMALAEKGAYKISDEMRAGLGAFYGHYASEEETYFAIDEVYSKSNYLMDPHTAVGYSVYKKYRERTKDTTTSIIASTASPYKFTRSVMNALDESNNKFSDFELIQKMHDISKITIPKAIKDILNAEIIHNTTCEVNKMKQTVIDILNLS